jgi:uncharacterized membrane protein
MDPWLAAGAVMLAGVLDFWLAVPTGLALGLHPAAACLAAFTGSVLEVLAVMLPGEWIGRWLAKRQAGKPKSEKMERARRIWDRYGLAGLAFFSIIFPGAPIAAMLALALCTPRWRVLLWFTVSLAVWSVAVTALAVWGLSAIGIHLW